jgi:AcrR family transcriptional regulator
VIATSRVRLSRVERRQQTREQLLDAAEEAFLERGFFATSLDDVAERAGFSKGAVYSNFPNKEAVLLAVVGREAERRLTSISEIAEGAGGTMEHQISEAGRAFTALVDRARPWQALYLECHVCAARNPDIARTLGEMNRRIRAQAVATLIDRYGGADSFTVTPDLMVAAFFAMGTGLAIERLSDPELPEDLFAVMLNGFTAGVTAAAPAPVPPARSRARKSRP